uniref:C-type lectin domain-containing protein n=1 Tax=Sander lucioperca TaxID=283035 RepID=A0A8C9YFW9_SANLU
MRAVKQLSGSSASPPEEDISYYIIEIGLVHEKLIYLRIFLINVERLNMTENQKVQAMIPAGVNWVWIGLFRDSWKWSDGSNSSFSFWKNGQPDNKNGNETCVAADFSQSGAWEDCFLLVFHFLFYFVVPLFSL